MPLAQSSRAIGEVAELLRLHLQAGTDISVQVGRPEPAPNNTLPTPRYNLFLYEAIFEGTIRHIPFDEQQNPPLWLVLRFLITSFDSNGESDSIAAHRQLGNGLRVLQELNYVSLDVLQPQERAALADNPEPLKITFAEANSNLLSTLMQGSDERYRFSMAFEVRPVMIAPVEDSSYSLLVGVNYEASPPAEIGEEGIDIEVFANLGMRVKRVEPETAIMGTEVTLYGENLETTDVVARLGPVNISPVVPGVSGSVRFTLNSTDVNGETISAGSHALTLVQSRNGRERSSNLRVLHLLPTLSSLSDISFSPIDSMAGAPLQGSFRIHGAFLGTATDDVYVALHDGNRAVDVFDTVADASVTPTPPAQTLRVVTIPEERAVPADDYRVIVRVNGRQARQSPLLTVAAP